MAAQQQMNKIVGNFTKVWFLRVLLLLQDGLSGRESSPLLCNFVFVGIGRSVGLLHRNLEVIGFFTGRRHRRLFMRFKTATSLHCHLTPRLCANCMVAVEWGRGVIPWGSKCLSLCCSGDKIHVSRPRSRIKDSLQLKWKLMFSIPRLCPLFADPNYFFQQNQGRFVPFAGPAASAESPVSGRAQQQPGSYQQQTIFVNNNQNAGPGPVPAPSNDNPQSFFQFPFAVSSISRFLPTHLLKSPLTEVLVQSERETQDV